LASKTDEYSDAIRTFLIHTIKPINRGKAVNIYRRFINI
jgi:hypothetical protein